MAAGATYTPITTQTLTSAQSSITLNTFSGYTDLVLVIYAKFTSTSANPRIQFNADASAIYSGTFVYGSNTTSGSYRLSGYSHIYLSGGAESTTIHPVYIVNFQNYANTTAFKSILTKNATAGRQVMPSSGLYRSTNAITSMILYATAGNFDTGSTFTLYGIKAA